MGQRFQLIINQQGNFKVLHFQWLWGFHAIRRIGKAIYYFQKDDSYRDFKQFLKMSCYGDPNDMNNFMDYYDEHVECFDNKVICDRKVRRSFKSFLKELDNNDGFLYLKISKYNEIEGYCFLSREDLDLYLTAEEYLDTKEWYREDSKGFTKKQQKWIDKGLKVFSKLKVINPPFYITKEV